MKIVAFAGLLAATIALLGCGGGASTTAGPDLVRGELSKAQWIEHADHVCRSSARASLPLESSFGRFVARQNLPMAGQTVRSIVSVLERNGERLRRLGVPTTGSKNVQRLTRQLERTIEQDTDLAEALEAGDASGAARLQFRLGQTRKLTLALAHRFGLRVCGSE